RAGGGGGAGDAAPRGDPRGGAGGTGGIGRMGAGRVRAGRLRVGGDLLVSFDAHARLERELRSLPRALAKGDREAQIGKIVDASLGAPGVVVYGVRSLASVRDVIVRAMDAAV